MDRDKIYSIIRQNRKKLDDSILKNKKRLIVEKIQELDLDINFFKYLKDETYLYIAPVHQFFKGKLINFLTETGDEIYIDDEFSNDRSHQDIILHELTHELLHSLCRQRKNKNIEQNFGHNWFDQNEIFIGIDEATTQMFTDDFEGKKLNETQDPNFYFIKNVMRVFKVIIGIDKLLMQYLNYNRDFEDEFNRISNGKFDEFACSINQIYELSYKVNNAKEKGIDSLQDATTLNELKNVMLENVNNLVRQMMKQKPELKFLLSEELQNSGFNLDANTVRLTNINGENFIQKNPFSKIIFQKFLAVREKYRINCQSIRRQQLIKSNLEIFENDDLKEGIKK